MSAKPFPEYTILLPGSKGVRSIRHTMRARDLFRLSAWCGLAAGLLEVGTMVLCRAIDPSQRLYLVSHHFIWLSPLSNLAFFMVIGLVLAVAIKLARARDRLVRPPLDLRLHDTAGPHCCRTPDLYLGMVACVTWTRCVPGPYLRATSKCVTNLAHSELPVHARSGSRAGGFRLRRELAQACASQAVRCRRAIRRTSFSSCWTRSEQTV